MMNLPEVVEEKGKVLAISRTQWLWCMTKAYWKPVMLVVTPLAALPLPLISGLNRDWCAYMMIIMAVYWVLELLPLAATAVIPVVMCPMLGLLGTSEVSMQYMTGSNMLFVGALILATSIEECNLHRRIALGAIKLIGSSPGLLMLGFMLSTALLSMWISNTATSAMMVPIMEVVLAELKALEEGYEDACTLEEGEAKDKELSNREESPRLRGTRAMLGMAICYSANIGGTGTLVGTGSNVVMMEYLNEFDGNPVSFGTWMGFAIPQMLLCLAAAWLWLYFYFISLTKWREEGNVTQDDERTRRNKAVSDAIGRKYAELGTLTFHEVVVLSLFVAAFLLWFFLSPGFMTGWGDKLESENGMGFETAVDDATPAILIAILLFAMPAKPNFFRALLNGRSDPQAIEPSPPVLTWKTAQHKVEWGIVLLLGGGYALAEASEQSCLSAWMGSQLLALEDMSDWALSLVGSILANALTQVVSNAATVSILLPVLRDLALALLINPLYLMIPPTLACSYAFMLPISTGPNAICFGPSGITVFTMIKLGFILDVICLAVITLAINTYGYLMFDLGEFPDWAENYNSVNDTLCDV